jgi:hypothetical protein
LLLWYEYFAVFIFVQIQVCGSVSFSCCAHFKVALVTRVTTLTCQGLSLSKGPNRVGVSFPSPEDGNRSSFRNALLSSYLEFQTLDKAHIPSDSAGWFLSRSSQYDVSIVSTKCRSFTLVVILAAQNLRLPLHKTVQAYVLRPAATN